ncbi:TetR/AcrR family transcriptional regulator [Mycobacterium sp. DL99]|uniref:TetR/AcrR family transcriptional regulator n=1 Tax=Mycobacterium sp. DL99 TaxID=2528957 RepID=UPI001081F201|nr:TetR/AcrR family transcriptional regulator [Mycobacterium sp. DL99]
MPSTQASREQLADDGDGSSRHQTLLSAVGYATVELSREHDHRELSRQLVADRAGLSYREVCAQFASIEALIAETCLDRLRESPLNVELDESARERMVGQFHQLITLLAHEPRYGVACVWALMSDAESVRPIRTEIDAEIRRHVSGALGPGAWPELVSALQLALLGAVVQASTNTTSLTVLSQQLGDLVEMLMPGGDADDSPGRLA